MLSAVIVLIDVVLQLIAPVHLAIDWLKLNTTY